MPADESLDQLGDRRAYLGASDIGPLFNRGEFGRTKLDVYREKVGQKAFLETPDTRRGKRLEAIAAEEWSLDTGQEVRFERRVLVHPRLDFLRGHIDRRVVVANRPLELKCPRSGKYYRIKADGLPDAYVLQGQTYALLDNAEAIDWGIFCADSWEIATFSLPANKTIQNKIEEVAARFWFENVLPRVPPAPVNKNDKEVLDTFERVGAEVQLVTNQEYIDAARLLREADKIIDDGEMLKEMAKQRIIAAIGMKFGKYSGGCLRLNYYGTKGKTSFDKKKLAESRPLDLTKVIKWLEERTGEMNTELVNKLIDQCALDLAEFETRGDPGSVFRPYYIDGGDD